MVKLVLLRHGESTANKANIYTGWSDVPLTEKGCQQAKQAGEKIKKVGIKFTKAHTSVLMRAIRTGMIVLDEINQAWIPFRKTWRLNERHYGALKGLNKDYTRRIYGEHQVALWRRSFDTVPPLLTKQVEEVKYKSYPKTIIPRGESLKDAYNRIIPYWIDDIAPELLHGNNQLVVAHGSTIRALIKYIEGISDEGIDGVEVKNAEPIIYEFNSELEVISKKKI